MRSAIRLRGGDFRGGAFRLGPARPEARDPLDPISPKECRHRRQSPTFTNRSENPSRESEAEVGLDSRTDRGDEGMFG